MLSSSQLIEVSFSDLEKDPVKTIGGIYEHFGWPGWETAAATVQEYCGGSNVKGFKKNKFHETPDDVKAMLQRRWRSTFIEFNYEP